MNRWAEVVEVRAPVWYADPIAFCEEVFFEPPREWQGDALTDVRDHLWTAIVACRNAGKTRTAAYLVLWFLCTRPECLVITTAATWDQVIQGLWADIRYLWANSYLPQIFQGWEVLQAEIKTTSHKWRAFGLSSNDPANTEGRHAGTIEGADGRRVAAPVLVVLDESQEVSDEFFNSLQGMLGNNPAHNRVLAIGRGGAPVGWFYRAFSDEGDLWHTRRIRADEIPRLQQHCERERLRLGSDNPTFRQHQLAEFTGAETGSIIGADMVDDAIRRFHKRADLYGDGSGWQKILALDPAGGGSDQSILTWRHGPLITKQKALQGDTMQVASATAAEAGVWEADIVIVDAVGLGEPVFDRIRELVRARGLGCRMIPFKAGHAAINSEQYDNRKTEIVFRMRDMLDKGEIAFADIDHLRRQMPLWTYMYTSRGKSRVKDPRDSPDWADSAMIAYAADTYTSGISAARVNFL
jgi:phage terminase large subunit